VDGGKSRKCWPIQGSSPISRRGFETSQGQGLEFAQLGTTDWSGGRPGSQQVIGAFEFQYPQSVISYGWLQNHGLAPDGSADYADADGDVSRCQRRECRALFL